MTDATKHKLPGLFFLWATYQTAEAFMHFHNDLFAFLSLMATVIILSYVIAKQYGMTSMATYKLEWNLEGKRLLSAGLLAGLIIYSTSFLISVAIGREIIRATEFTTLQVAAKVLLCMAGTFLPSLAEDIITRGYLLFVWGKRRSKLMFVLVSSVFYVLNHTYKISEPDESLVYLFITGIALSIPLVITNSLWYTVGLHWACNIVYRVTNNVLYSTSLEEQTLTSFRILMIVVLVSIPFNMYVLKQLKLNMQ